MIYTVELNFSDASKTDEWNAWYETYLKQLVSLDGLETAQRFRAVAGSEPTWEYLALYTVPNLDVYESEAYRKIGGGGNASKAFHHAISRRRNVYNGVERMAAVSDEARVLFGPKGCRRQRPSQAFRRAASAFLKEDSIGCLDFGVARRFFRALLRSGEW